MNEELEVKHVTTIFCLFLFNILYISTFPVENFDCTAVQVTNFLYDVMKCIHFDLPTDSMFASAVIWILAADNEN